MARPERWQPGEPLRLFAVAGEHSGDRLGGKLLAVLRQRLGDRLIVAGVGAEDMLAKRFVCKPIRITRLNENSVLRK